MRKLLSAVLVALVGQGLAATPVAARTAPDRLSDHVIRTDLVDTAALGGTLRDGRSELRVNVLLPASYAAQPTRRFPVLYLLHGADGGYDDYERELGVSSLLEDFPGVVVMPDAGTYGNYMDWVREGSPSWETFLLERLRGWVHEHYRIRPGRRWHAVAGLSGGGQGALRLASDLPSYFGAVMGMSAAMPDMQDPVTVASFAPVISQKAGQPVTYDDVYGPADGWYATAANPFSKIGQLTSTRVYLTYGDGQNCEGDPVNPQSIAVDTALEQQIAQQNTRYADALAAAGVDVTDRPTCGVHTWPVWERGLADAAETWGFFRKPPAAPRTWDFLSGRTRGTAWDVRFTRSPPLTDALVLHRTGRTIEAEGSGPVVLRVRDCSQRLELPATWTIPARCA